MTKYIIIAVLSFLSMEIVAWLSHRYIMHGFLWMLHRDHHVPMGKNKVLEKNDSFFVLFAVPAIICFLVGFTKNIPELIAIAVGITVYGLAYFLVHDLFIHQRLPILKNTKNRYLLGLRRAHKIHHKYLGKHDGECFGMLLFPVKFLKRK